MNDNAQIDGQTDKKARKGNPKVATHRISTSYLPHAR